MRFPNPIKFFKALWIAFVCWRRGQQVWTSAIVRNNRMGVCLKCPHYDPFVAQCDRCTCFVRLKCSLAFEKCPDGRWGWSWNVVDTR